MSRTSTPNRAQGGKSAAGAGNRAATLSLMIALGRTDRALQQAIRPQLAERELGLTEFAVLEALLHKGPLTLGEVRDRILVAGASITYVVKKLESRGLLRRLPLPDDQRTVLAELTPAGRALIEAVFPEHVEQLCQLTRGLSVAEKRTAVKLLRRLTDGAAQAGPRSEDRE